MEWNARPSLQWDWENLTVLNPRISGHGDILHPTNFENKHGMNVGSSNSVGDARITGGPFFELGKTSPKNSKSVSQNSLSIEKSRTTKFTLEGFEPTLEDIDNKYEFVETSICSCEPMLSLKLGKQAYFENTSAGNVKKPSVPLMESRATRKRCQNTLSPHCQVEGCNIDLSNAKDYYRKHRVCECHSKSPKVIIGGIERRFCQQCSRFHGISDFDEKKRSCRRRLSNHNARRRKPQSKVISLNPARLSSWDFAWESELNTRHPQCGQYVLKSEQACGSTGQLNVSRNEMRCVRAMPYHDTSKLVTFKGPATRVLDAAQDLQRALSLLSTDLKGPYEAKLISSDSPNRHGNPNYANQTATSQSPMDLGIQSLPFASVDSGWPIESQVQVPHPSIEGNGLLQDLQLFKTPCEIGMFSNN